MAIIAMPGSPLKLMSNISMWIGQNNSQGSR
jgi:hypothetical protein